ncbi:MAG: HAMP domain-containing sensor histidine kinase [bacterium]|nr:HAMP domain-containing sensor histidine kinase [bacterium]
MVNGNGKAAIALVTSELPTWANDILSYLREQGYQVDMIQTGDEDVQLPPGSLPDAVIALNVRGQQRLFETLQAETPRALRVLITETFNDDLPYDWADIILPPRPSYIDCQLEMLLRLRTENETLRQKTAALEARIKTLETEAEDRKRITSEVEILKNAIVRNVSHELKTPLLHVKSAVSLIAEDMKDQELIKYAVNATARLETLVKNITLLGSSLDINPGPVIVRDAIEYARRNLGRVWEHKDDASRIQIHVQEHLPPVKADKQAISTALQLLIDNALKFSEKPVEVSATQEDSTVKITVRDYGIGIPKEHLDRIFDTFFQIDPSSTRRYGGTGVGLSIVRIIMERHNTRIYVMSKENEGSTFWFFLPVLLM